MIEAEGELGERRLQPQDPLPFRCHPALACFNSCCQDKRLTLLPYDVLRLSRALGRTSGELLAEHGELEIEPGSGWPTLRLRLLADGRCPFVAEAGCRVYRDRPTCCRIYPLARAVSLGRDGTPRDAFLVEATSARCLGFGETGAQSVEAWTRTQELEPYRAANDRTAALLLDRRRPRPLSLTSDGVHAVVMALYNLDAFRELAARPGFAGRAGLPAERVARALASDEALLELGHDWLAARLFGRGSPAAG